MALPSGPRSSARCGSSSKPAKRSTFSPATSETVPMRSKYRKRCYPREAQKVNFRKISEHSGAIFRTMAPPTGSTRGTGWRICAGHNHYLPCSGACFCGHTPSGSPPINSIGQLGDGIVRLLTLSVLLAGSILANGALAQSMDQDDLKWINQCIRDNRDEGASASVVRAYCLCMNEKMDSRRSTAPSPSGRSRIRAPAVPASVRRAGDSRSGVTRHKGRIGQWGRFCISVKTCFGSVGTRISRRRTGGARAAPCCSPPPR